MAVKGSATITLTQYRDTQSVTRYYKLQTAGSSAPSKPTTKPPSSDWTDSEPACDISKELYFCDLTIFSNGEGEYSTVSKSSSYEAAKQAYNKANDASTAAGAAQDSIDNLEIGGRNLIKKGELAFNACQATFNSTEEIGVTGIRSDATSCIIFGDFPAGTYTLNYSLLNTSILRIISSTAFDEYCIANSYYASILGGTGYFRTMESLPFTFTLTETTRLGIILHSKSYVDDTISSLKLEIGNRATDWTPAPEDVDAGIANAQTAADTAKANAATAQSTADTAKANAATAQTAADNAQATADEVAEVTDGKLDISDYDSDKEVLDSTIGDINTEIDGIHTTTDNLSKEISNELVAKGYAKIIPEEPSIELGRNASDWKVKITNESVDLQKSGSSGAKLSPNPERANETLFRADTVRLSNVYFRSADNQGKLGIVAQSNGHISLKEI